MSDDFEEERRAIEGRFKNAWGAKTPIRMDNARWKDLDPEETPAYVALFIVNGLGQQIELRETALVRFNGQIIVQVFTKERTGNSRARKLANDVADVFRRADFARGSSGRIRCRIPTIVRVGDNNGWYQLNVSTPFMRDAFHVRA